MTQYPRLAFAGTPAFAVPTLQALIESPYRPIVVLTQPDRPAGRGRRVSISPVKELAGNAGVPVWQPESLRSEAAREHLRTLDLDLMVVIAYGLILPEPVLAAPRLGAINLHASLLPRWRGAAPIQRALLAGDRKTGVCLMQMERGLDTGPVLARVETPIEADATAVTLHDCLARLSADLLLRELPAVLAGRLPATPQPAEGATYAHKLEKAEAWIDWGRPATELDRQVRALQPWPVAQTQAGETVLRVHAAKVIAGTGVRRDSSEAVPPGTVLGSAADGIDVATGGGVLRLTAVQRPGKTVVPASLWWRDCGSVGLVFGQPHAVTTAAPDFGSASPE
jgi:methionyl-tRNA formyltransferase